MVGGRRSLPCLLLLTYLFSGCAETDPELILTSPTLSFEELKQRVSQIRGLPFLSEVSLETKTLEEIQALHEKSLLEEHGNERLLQVERIYARLGLLPVATDLRKALLELHLFEKSVHTNYRGKRLVLPQGPLKPGHVFLRSPWTVGDDLAKQLLLSHALTHALHEQHFQWEEKLKKVNTEDWGLALRSLATGDAVLVGLSHLIGDAKENRQKFLEGLSALVRLAAQMDKELPHLPELLRQKAAFQYLEGSQFVLWALSSRGWEGVNRLFSHPPHSTKQILHPEKYYVKKDDPVQITPWAIIRRFSGQKIMEETLGEFLIQVLLAFTLSKEEAVQAAAGWTGDSLLAFQQGEELVLSWVTAWENREEAQEFFRSYRRALEKRYGIILESPSSSGDTFITAPQSAHPILLQIRGNFVFFLDGIQPPHSVEIAEGLWRELESGTEPQQIPMDLVRQTSRPSQSPPVRK